MKIQYLKHAAVFIALLCLTLATIDDGMKNKIEETRRKAKLFPLFQVVTFVNEGCIGAATRNGTCYSTTECSNKGGTASGTCASGYGVCCIFSLSCGGTTSQNNSYLVQTTTTQAPSINPCTYTICKCSTNICRIRLDFTTFNIAAPVTGTTTTTAASVVTGNGGGIGDCTIDQFTLTSPGNVGSPVICGFNTGQHMIVDASAICSVASFDIGSSGDSRAWDIKVTQYKCGDEQGGPDGCLQYFTGVSGRVSSYNFPTSSSTVGASTTHLSSQCYTMCFRQEFGRCSICFTTAITVTTVPNVESAQSSFGLSITTAAIASGQINTNCISDYLIIPNGMPAPAALPSGAERFCGRVLTVIQDSAITGTSVCSFSRPFRVSFKSNGDEVTTGTASTNNEQSLAPGGIVGFSLNYVEQAC